MAAGVCCMIANSTIKPSKEHACFNVFADSCSPAQRLGYFQQRDTVHFFPILDTAMTQREIIDELVAQRFAFNAESYQLNTPLNWLENPSDDIEWHILLHKFYYAAGLGKAWCETAEPRYLQQWVALTDSWIQQTPINFIAPEVTGRRVQNWIYAWYYFVANNSQSQRKMKTHDYEQRDNCITPDFHDRFLDSLAKQVNYLCEHLAPARNHRTIALYSIFLAAVVFPEMSDAPRWQRFSWREIHRNIEQDLLDDGVQCELSTDYHHLVLKNYLAIRRLAEGNAITMSADFDQRLNRALDFALYAHKPDGEVPAFSDGDVGSFLDLLAQGATLFQRQDLLYGATQGKQGCIPKQRNARFDQSGYYILRSGWGEKWASYQQERYLMFDCGSLGAGNHGHLDALSFEMAAFGRSLIVDPARYTYNEKGATNWRVKFRSTEAHNTVLVDGKNQTRYVQGPSRYKIKGKAPDTQLHCFFTTEKLDYLHGSTQSHEYDALHQRQILFVSGEYWILVDTLNSPSEHCYEQLFHLTPQAEQELQTRKNAISCQLISPQLIIATPNDQEQLLITDMGFVSKQYGEKQAAPVLRFVRHARNTRFVTVLYPFKAQDTPVDIFVSVLPDATKEGFMAVTITQQHTEHTISDICFLPIPDGMQHANPYCTRSEYHHRHG
jgi:hypothetical protein